MTLSTIGVIKISRSYYCSAQRHERVRAKRTQHVAKGLIFNMLLKYRTA